MTARQRNRLTASCLLLSGLLVAGCSSSHGSAADGGPSVDSAGDPDQGTTSADPLPEAQLIEACARATACGVKRYPSLSTCLSSYRDLYLKQGLSAAHDAVYRCVNAAGGDCDEVRGCFGARGACDKSYRATCEGSVAVSCDLIDKQIYALDCAPARLQCKVKSDATFTAVCTRGGCDTSYRDRCSGSWQLTCAASVIEARDCALDGLTCVETKDAAGCAGNQDKTCRAGAVTPFCDDQVAVSCELVRVHRRDCAAEGMTCVDGACQRPARLCDEALPDRCAGDVLEACVGDEWRTVDCAALGLGPCARRPEAEWSACTAP